MSPRPPQRIEFPDGLLAGREIGWRVRRIDSTPDWPVAPDHLVAGEEFCERLLPDWDELAELLDGAAVPVRTLLTPPVTDDGLRKLERLFDSLAQRRPDLEITVNDWGVDDLLTAAKWPFPKVLGRLMNKQRRDPRFPPAASHVQTDLFAAWLTERGYSRLEWDPRWPTPTPGAATLPGTLRWPEVVLTWTRSCLPANLAADPTGRTALGVVACQRPCREGSIVIEKRHGAAPLRLRGNAMLYAATELPPGIADQAIDRVVLDEDGWPWM